MSPPRFDPDRVPKTYLAAAALAAAAVAKAVADWAGLDAAAVPHLESVLVALMVGAGAAGLALLRRAIRRVEAAFDGALAGDPPSSTEPPVELQWRSRLPSGDGPSWTGTDVAEPELDE